MIGLGSQYLTAAGFGRYRITAASLGNLDLLGTYDWLKLAAKQAILGAFGDDGKAVINATNAYLNGIAASDRDKATALAWFINEDPMMVCSLGLEPQGVTMPWRYMVGTGTQYINMGGTITNGGGGYFKARFKITAFFPGSVSQGYYGVVGENSNPQLAYGQDAWSVGNATSQNPYKPTLNSEYVVEWNTGGNGNMRIDGQSTGLSRSGTLTLKIFYTMSVPCPVAIAEAIARGNNYEEKHLVPMLHNGVACMIDLNKVGVDGATLFYYNQGTGQFTIPDISYTPSTP